MQAVEDGRRITVTGPDFRYVFSKTQGVFESLVKSNASLMTRPMTWNTYRAPTDNDQDIDAAGKQAGYDCPQVKVYGCESRVENGVDFEGIGKRHVRLRVPQDITELARRLERIEAELQAAR